MKTFALAAVAVLAMSATAASALDIGSTGLQFNNKVVSEYTTNSEDFSLGYTPELRYIPLEGLSVYVKSEFDVEDPNFTGATFGVEYMPGVASLDLVTYVKATSDQDLNFDGVVIGAELNF